MQLDIFEQSRDVVLRNAAIDALRTCDTAACAQAVAALAAEYGADPLLPAFGLLCEKLHSPIPNPVARGAAIAILQQIEGAVATAAHAVFGGAAQTWLSPLWAELAEGLRLAQAGANTRAERCARIVLGLFVLERQGRHAELVEGRRKLREVHPVLFARYMQDR